MTSSVKSSESKLALWRECFGDDESTVKAFYAIPDIRGLSFVSDGQVVGMADIVPVLAGGLRGGYLYAIGVKKEYRGRGICRTFLEAAENMGYDFLCLIPGDDELAKTYRRYGYTQRVLRYGYPQRIGACPIRCASEGFLAYANADVSGFGQKYGLMKRLMPRSPAGALYFASPMGEV